MRSIAAKISLSSSATSGAAALRRGGAQCPLQSFKLLPLTREYVKLAVGKELCVLLKELFGPMTVESVVM